MKALSLFVVFTFVCSLGAPIVHAQSAATASAAGSAAANTMTNVATHGLGDLWFFWGEHLKNLKVTPTKEAAFSFFTARGATESQALALAHNAEAAGQLTSAMPAAAQATGNVFTRMFDKDLPSATRFAVSSAASRAVARALPLPVRLASKRRTTTMRLPPKAAPLRSLESWGKWVRP